VGRIDSLSGAKRPGTLPLRPFRSSIQLYNFILHLHMDPGGKIFTIDEFRCWKVENLDDQRSDENKNEGGGYRVVSPQKVISC
jgi:hypothetical protein